MSSSSLANESDSPTLRIFKKLYYGDQNVSCKLDPFKDEIEDECNSQAETADTDELDNGQNRMYYDDEDECFHSKDGESVNNLLTNMRLENERFNH